MLDHVYSLAREVGATDVDLLALARLVAGDSPVECLEDLNPAGLAEVVAALRWFKGIRQDWDSVLSYYEIF